MLQMGGIHISHTITLDDDVYRMLNASADHAQRTPAQLISILIMTHAAMIPHTVRCTEQDIYEWTSLVRPPAPAIPPELLRREAVECG